MISMTKIFDSQAVVKNTTVKSAVIDLRPLAKAGIFSIQLEEVGDGTGKWKFELSNNYNPATGTGDFITPTGASDIVTAFVKTTGPGSDGKDIYQFEPEVALFMKITVTETGNANPLESSAWIVVQ